MAEAEDIWHDLIRTVDRMYSQATDLSGFFFPEGAPIESKLELMASKLTGSLRSKDYRSAIKDMREVVEKLRSYVDEIWPEFGP
jgi:hypothetical protein